MKFKIGFIYYYLVLFVTTCSLIIISSIVISNVYDLYYPREFDHQKMRTVLYEKIQEKDFKWDAPENKQLKKYAIDHYRKKHDVVKDILICFMIGFVALIHAFLLRRMKKQTAVDTSTSKNLI